MADIFVLRSWVRRAARVAEEASKPLGQVLEEIGDAVLLSAATSGRVVISSAEAGGSVTFALPLKHTPLELSSMNEEAISWAVDQGLVDPDDLTIPAQRRIKRMRVSFAKATI